MVNILVFVLVFCIIICLCDYVVNRVSLLRYNEIINVVLNDNYEKINTLVSKAVMQQIISEIDMEVIEKEISENIVEDKLLDIFTEVINQRTTIEVRDVNDKSNLN